MTDTSVLEGLQKGRTALFVKGVFHLHSGDVSTFKIECDALTDADWCGLAEIAYTVLPLFGEVVSVPRGGDKLAEWLRHYATSQSTRRVIVDDVLTTGRSMREAMTRPDDIGLVVFARGPLPPRVTALFSMPGAAPLLPM